MFGEEITSPGAAFQPFTTEAHYGHQADKKLKEQYELSISESVYQQSGDPATANCPALSRKSQMTMRAVRR